jgi:hypothetical protein
MTPQLAGGEYGPGLRTGVDALAGIIARGFGVTDTMLTGGDRAIYRGSRAPRIPPKVIFAIIIIAIIVISNISSRGDRRVMDPGDAADAVGDRISSGTWLGRRIRRLRWWVRRNVRWRWWRWWVRRIRRRGRLQRRRRRRRLLT